MKVAIITGAGSGIGLETAKLLHAAGVAVVGVGRDKGKLAALEAAIGDAAGRVRYCLSASMFAGRHDEAQWAAIGTMMVAAATAIRRKEEGRE